MKKLLIVFALLICNRFAVAQDPNAIEVIQRLTLENDSLKRRIESVRKTSNERIGHINDSLLRLNNEYRTLKGKVLQLQEDLDKEKKNAEKLKDIKIERDDLEQQNADLLVRLDNEKKERYEAGRKSVIGLIEQTYNLDFDALLMSTSLQTIQRDLPFVEDAAIKEKMQDLQAYFEARQVLSEKYDEQKMIDAQTKIQSIVQTDAVKTLGTSMWSYKFCYDALKKTIGKINKIDSEAFANTEKTRKEKKKDIWAELSDYFLEYKFDFAEYPYLSGIVMEIINRKQKDANADISDLMEEPVKPNSNARIKPVKP